MPKNSRSTKPRTGRPIAPSPTRRADGILAGACSVFSAKGFAATSMREISRAARASPGSIYHHFEGKEDILRAIICGNFRRVHASLDERLEGAKDERHALEIFVANHVSFFARHLPEMRVMSHELDTLTGTAGEEVAALRRAYTSRARRILEALRPDMSPQDLQVATLALFGMLNWTYRWFHTLPKSVGADALGAHMATIFLDGFVARRRTRS